MSDFYHPVIHRVHIDDQEIPCILYPEHGIDRARHRPVTRKPGALEAHVGSVIANRWSILSEQRTPNGLIVASVRSFDDSDEIEPVLVHRIGPFGDSAHVLTFRGDNSADLVTGREAELSPLEQLIFDGEAMLYAVAHGVQTYMRRAELSSNDIDPAYLFALKVETT
jgi:hypothetical protein